MTDKKTLEITKVIIADKEGKQDSILGKELSYEEAQSWIYKEDYRVGSQPDNDGWYDKCVVEVYFTVNDEEPKDDSVVLRVDLGDEFRHVGANSLKNYIQNMFPDYEIINADVKYDKDAYIKEYGTKEEQVDKFLAEHPVEMPQGINSADKTLDEIGEGDIFEKDGVFFKVTKRTPTSVNLVAVETIRKKFPIKTEGRYGVCIDYKPYIFPGEKEITTPSWTLVDTNKLFRLKSFQAQNKQAQASQGRETLYAYNGKAQLVESTETRSIYASLNENLCKFFESI